MRYRTVQSFSLSLLAIYLHFGRTFQQWTDLHNYSKTGALYYRQAPSGVAPIPFRYLNSQTELHIPQMYKFAAATVQR